MKKQFLAVSALALAVMSGSALAAPQDVQFVGTVTDVTCDIQASVNGSTNNYVQLGNAPLNDVATEVLFSLKPAAGTSCDLKGANTASVTWIGSFDGEGLTAQGGAALDAKALLVALNSKTQDTEIKNTLTQVDFDASELTGNDGLKFSAQLKGGATPGDYISSAAFLVQYN
ncbi:fimbrial protein PefA [Salmonella enterica]|nr:fimbrial protein PefA [Salmonella enterica]ELU8076090.1 fimbrial protein PefA [Salmonella enterica]